MLQQIHSAYLLNTGTRTPQVNKNSQSNAVLNLINSPKHRRPESDPSHLTLVIFIRPLDKGGIKKVTAYE